LLPRSLLVIPATKKNGFFEFILNSRSLLAIVSSAFHCFCSLDGRHVAFGYVVDGMSVVNLIDASGSATGASKRQVLITDCGVVA
jgi:cyclophilin family peptidyl-prolyl cis-trans isomerase